MLRAAVRSIVLALLVALTRPNANITLSNSSDSSPLAAPSLSAAASRGRVTVIQYGENIAYINHHVKAIASIREFAEEQGFRYHFINGSDASVMSTLNNFTSLNTNPTTSLKHCVYTNKVRATHFSLHTLTSEGDWILLVDVDVTYTACNKTHFLSLMPTTDSDGRDCRMIIQGIGTIVNSGFFAFQHSPAGLELADLWLEEEFRQHHCRGPADQIALQAAIVMLITGDKSKRKDCDPRFGIAQFPFGEANQCFVDSMKKAGYPYQERSGAGICIIGPSRRVNMHGSYLPGDVFWHHGPEEPNATLSCRKLDRHPTRLFV